MLGVVIVILVVIVLGMMFLNETGGDTPKRGVGKKKLSQAQSEMVKRHVQSFNDEEGNDERTS